MTGDDEVLRMLRLAIDRVGAASLARRPGLARNVLGDLLHDDPLSVSLLSGAAEQGVLDRLLELSAGDLPIVAPRLAEALAASRGLVPEQARWAVDTWATALGLSAPTVEQEETAASAGSSPADEPGSVVTHGSMAPEPQTPAPQAEGTPPDQGQQPTPVPQPTAVPQSAPVPQTTATPSGSAVTRRAAEGPPPGGQETRPARTPASKPHIGLPVRVPALASARPPRGRKERASGVEPGGGGRRRRRMVIVVAALAVLLVGVLSLVLSQVLGPGRADASAWSKTAVVQPKGPGVVATVSHDMAEPLGGKPVTLRNGDQVEVKKGPVEVRLGESAIRLAEDTTISYTAGTASSLPLITMTAGQVWVTVAPGQQLNLRSPSSEHANLESGRFVATCDNTCTYETLDEPQVVHSGGYRYVMQPHQRFVPSTASTESMNSQMNMSTPAPSATKTDSMGMSTAAPDPNAPKPEFVAPDILRSTPWIAANIASDAKQGRHYRGVSGRSLLGTWTVMLERPDVPADVHRVLRFSLSHCDVATCALSATTTYSDVGGVQRSIRAYAEIGDAKGNVVKLTYDPVSTACRTFGRADGTQDLVDNLTFAGATGGSGVRVAKYTPGAGSTCTSATDRAVQAATIDIVGHSDVTKRNAPFTSPGPTESLVLGHVHGPTSSCSPNQQGLAGETADATCTPPSASSGGPKTIAYYSFPDDASLTKAYDAQVAGSRQKANTGDCSAGACERAIPGGRRLIYGDAFLVEMDRQFRMMIVASGSVRSQLAHWRDDERDFSFQPFAVRGF